MIGRLKFFVAIDPFAMLAHEGRCLSSRYKTFGRLTGTASGEYRRAQGSILLQLNTSDFDSLKNSFSVCKSRQRVSTIADDLGLEHFLHHVLQLKNLSQTKFLLPGVHQTVMYAW